MRFFSLAALAAVVLGSPQPASADGLGSIDFGIQCTPGAFRACASVDIWTAVNSEGGTSVHATISNLQGAPGFEALQPAGMLGFWIGGLSLFVEDCVVAFDLGCDTEEELWHRLARFGSGTSEEVLSLDGQVTTWVPLFQEGVGEQRFQFDGAGAEVGFTFTNDDDNYYGCDFPDEVRLSSAFSLCDGSIDFEFNLGPEVRLGPEEA